MYVLDTDHLSLIQRNSEEGKRVLDRLSHLDSSQVAVTIVTYEEQVRGRLKVIAQAKTSDQQISAYHWLQKLTEDYRVINLLPFDRDAVAEYQRLKKQYPRLGSMDLKIAAIAILHQAILLTRNQSDFGKIIALQSEDWTRS